MPVTAPTCNCGHSLEMHSLRNVPTGHPPRAQCAGDAMGTCGCNSFGVQPTPGAIRRIPAGACACGHSQNQHRAGAPMVCMESCACDEFQFVRNCACGHTKYEHFDHIGGVEVGAGRHRTGEAGKWCDCLTYHEEAILPARLPSEVAAWVENHEPTEDPPGEVETLDELAGYERNESPEAERARLLAVQERERQEALGKVHGAMRSLDEGVGDLLKLGGTEFEGVAAEIYQTTAHVVRAMSPIITPGDPQFIPLGDDAVNDDGIFGPSPLVNVNITATGRTAIEQEAMRKAWRETHHGTFEGTRRRPSVPVVQSSHGSHECGSHEIEPLHVEKGDHPWSALFGGAGAPAGNEPGLWDSARELKQTMATAVAQQVESVVHGIFRRFGGNPLPTLNEVRTEAGLEPVQGGSGPTGDPGVTVLTGRQRIPPPHPNCRCALPDAQLCPVHSGDSDPGADPMALTDEEKAKVQAQRAALGLPLLGPLPLTDGFCCCGIADPCPTHPDGFEAHIAKLAGCICGEEGHPKSARCPEHLRHPRSLNAQRALRGVPEMGSSSVNARRAEVGLPPLRPGQIAGEVEFPEPVLAEIQEAHDALFADRVRSRGPLGEIHLDVEDGTGEIDLSVEFGIE